MKKKQKPFIIKFLILTVITALIWVGFDVYRAFTTKPKPDVPDAILAPIDPTLDKELLDNLSKRVYLEGAPNVPAPAQTASPSGETQPVVVTP